MRLYLVIHLIDRIKTDFNVDQHNKNISMYINVFNQKSEVTGCIIQEILAGLEEKAHEVVNYNGYIAQAQTIQNTCLGHSSRGEEAQEQNDGCILAVCDGRKDGVPDGY